ncbi:hypothetical protein [Pseudomonas sp. NMI542_15]|uniref:hypothetical protein n=1 Tax=Pseudomonas sp. NMI542_15 TaxID=2903148 RepID=UPI001E59B051|nr:hypothetical protein [Pseudomonas sp. NMI542_15]MCE0778878.1 hypothetical protein [Pseudomonas sp. NMI542_15]
MPEENKVGGSIESTEAMKYGQQLWLMLASTFNEATLLDGFGKHPEKAQAYLGFIAAACGAMFVETGREATMAALAAIAQTVDKKPHPAESKH